MPSRRLLIMASLPSTRTWSSSSRPAQRACCSSKALRPSRVGKADALLHFGTHGSLEFMPGKQVGMSGRNFLRSFVKMCSVGWHPGQPGIVSPLLWVIIMVTLLITPLIRTHEPPSAGSCYPDRLISVLPNLYYYAAARSERSLPLRHMDF